MILLTLVATSFFLFPFEFTMLPGVNTKMMMAVWGGGLVAWRLIVTRSLDISRDFLWMCLFAGLFSLVSLFAVSYNQTSDYSYVFYIVSMLVWLAAAYAVCTFISFTHRIVTFRLLVNYLLAVCVIQCLLALLIDFQPVVKDMVDHFQNASLAKSLKRLYGIGAALDVAGTRFAATLVMTMLLICVDKQILRSKKILVIYLVSFVIVAVCGNMIARTTLVGLILAVPYLIYATRIYQINMKKSSLLLWSWIATIFFLMIILIIFLYHVNTDIHKLLRFAFEGFFKWYEKGTWQTDSTETLKNMWVYPEQLKTWLIGDGYFENPYFTDSNYTGPKMEGFYMNTDVGYLRFIFYNGLLGLSVFIFFFFQLSVICAKKYIQERHLFVLLFILQLMIFGKVATDLFLIYAYFFCANIQEKTETNESYS